MKPLVALLAASAVFGWSASATADSPVTGSRLLVPAYFDPPSPLWRTTLTAPASAILIANPDNGPGNSSQAAYRSLLTTPGHEFIGYVHTSDGHRPVAAVERDIDRWAGFYGVHGIFFDEVAQSAAQLPYYRTITGYARAHGAAEIVLNPGTVPAQGYFGLGAVVVTFEDDYAHFVHARFPSWLRNYPASAQANIVYAVPNAAAAQAALALAHQRGVGVGFATDERLPDPYAGLPAYYGQESGWLNG